MDDDIEQKSANLEDLALINKMVDCLQLNERDSVLDSSSAGGSESKGSVSKLSKSFFRLATNEAALLASESGSFQVSEKLEIKSQTLKIVRPAVLD